MPAVARKFIRVTTLVGTSDQKPLSILASAEQPSIAFVLITVYLIRVISKSSMWLSSLMAVRI